MIPAPPPPPSCSGLDAEAAAVLEGGSPDGTADHDTNESASSQDARARERAPSEDFLALIDHAYARRHLILSAGQDEKTGAEILRTSASTPPLALFNVGVVLRRARGHAVEAAVLPEVEDAELLAAAIDHAYDQAARDGDHRAGSGSRGDEITVVVGAGSSDDLARDLARAVQEAEADLLRTEGKAPTVRLVDLILFEALRSGASDVHIQPLKDRTLVRYRVDGALHTTRELRGGGALAAAVVSRVKVMARMDVAEVRAPQDGRAGVSIGGVERGGPGVGPGSRAIGRRIDLRISTLPSTYGERVVIRLLDPTRSTHLESFAALGMPADLEAAYLREAARASGIVLSTGPTGSGKTTTLYATLAWISASNAGGASRGCELNMMTIEDPVEYDLTDARLAVSQTQVDTKKNVSFATGLRHILRQDPDVIMVGEIRDEETARIAVQASLTGHLVLSTLHTSDAAGAVARLIDLGVEPFLVASSLAAVLAQRLVRRVHAPCAGQGCADCHHTGFRGRVGVFELLIVDAAMRELIGRRCSAVEVQTLARARGMRTLRQEGAALVAAGITSAAEVARVIEALDEEVEARA